MHLVLACKCQQGAQLTRLGMATSSCMLHGWPITPFNMLHACRHILSIEWQHLLL